MTFNTISTAALLAAVFMSTASTAGATPTAIAIAPAAADFAASDVITISQGVNGRNVTAVFYPGGSIVQKGGRWVESNDEGQNIFAESHRDDWSVYLFDTSRDVTLQLDLHRRTIFYSDGGPKSPLYEIIDVSAGKQKQAGQGKKQRRSEVATYSCNEGIPLSVRFEERGNRTYALFSHDGLPEIALKQRKSGSGSRFANGEYTLVLQGKRASLYWGESEDHCNAS